MKKYPSSNPAFLEKKIGHISNDLTKQILFDLMHLRLFGDKFETEPHDHELYKELVARLEKHYKDSLHKIRQRERSNSKQLDLEEEINKINETEQSNNKETSI